MKSRALCLMLMALCVVTTLPAPACATHDGGAQFRPDPLLATLTYGCDLAVEEMEYIAREQLEAEGLAWTLPDGLGDVLREACRRGVVFGIEKLWPPPPTNAPDVDSQPPTNAPDVDSHPPSPAPDGHARLEPMERRHVITSTLQLASRRSAPAPRDPAPSC